MSLYFNAVLRAAVFAVSYLLLASLSIAEESSDGSIGDGVRRPAVTVAIALEAEIIGRIPVSGTLVPRQEVLIYPQVSGYTIDKLLFDIGDVVSAGDVLAQLNDRTLATRLAQSEAEYASAQAAERQAHSQITAANAAFTQNGAVLERTQRLADSGTTTQAVLDQAVASAQTARANLASAMDGLAVAQAQILQAEAQLQIVRLDLEHAQVTSPADGLISERNGQVGGIASSGGTPIFRLIADGLIEVEAEVIETALDQIELGDTVLLDIAGLGESVGKIRLISPRVDPVNRLGMIRVELDEVPNLRAGLYAGGWIIVEQHKALTVPSSAVLTDTDGSYVLTVTDGQVSKRDVIAGLIWQGNREILSGLSAGEVVLAKAGAFFADGDLVTPISEGDEIAAGASE